MSKFCSLYFTTHYGDSSQPSPSIPAAPEARALVAFAPTESNKEQPHSDEKESEENEEQEILKERMELMHFNNASYFILQRAWELCRKEKITRRCGYFVLLDFFHFQASVIGGMTFSSEHL